MTQAQTMLELAERFTALDYRFAEYPKITLRPEVNEVERDLIVIALRAFKITNTNEE